MSEIEETAKATQEVAKTTNKALEVGEKFGRFIAKYIGGTLEQGFGIWEDKLKYIRWENQYKLMTKANNLLKERGLLDNIKPLPLKVAIPLFEKASLEDDDYLQNLWTNLLVNSVTPNMEIDLNKTYINILEQLSPLEAQTLMVIYSIDDESYRTSIETFGLPEYITYHSNNTESKDIKEPNDSIKLVLENLLRLGCISLATLTIGGGQSYGLIHQTLLGKKLTNSLK